MNRRFQLVGLNDSVLRAGLSSIAAQCNGLTAELLAHLGEVAERMLHLEAGFPSLHAYCVRHLRMSEGAAGRRVAAARVCRRFPVAFEFVARGELHLSALCALEGHLSAENAEALLTESAGQTRRRVEELLAARFPKPDVRERIVRLPMRAAVPSAETAGTDAVVEARQVATSLAPAQVSSGTKPRGVLEALSADRFGVHFTADRELRELIERARAVAGHRLPTSDLAGLMKLALLDFVKREEQRRFAVGGKAWARATPPGGVALSAKRGDGSAEGVGGFAKVRGSDPGRRAIAAEVRRRVYQRDGAQCTFVAADGRRCDARRRLEFDHIEPWARRGGDDAENLRLRCRAHNLLHARRGFGALHVAAKRAAASAAERY